MIIVGLGSNIIAKVTKEEMISKKLSMRPVVHYHWNKFDGVCFDYDDEVREVIHQSQYRADLINDIILSREEKKSLISFREIEHGRFMYENYVRKHGKYVHGGIVDWVHGEDEDRARKLQDYKDGKIRVLFASTIMQEGINVKDIDVLIYGQGGKSAVGVSQFSGRVERLSGTGEETVEFHDIYDDYKTVAKHSRKRANLLKKEGFEIIYHYEQRRGKPTGDKEETNVA
jgi:superfamily II DNA or RNA helicase